MEGGGYRSRRRRKAHTPTLLSSPPSQSKRKKKSREGERERGGRKRMASAGRKAFLHPKAKVFFSFIPKPNEKLSHLSAATTFTSTYMGEKQGNVPYYC